MKKSISILLMIILILGSSIPLNSFAQESALAVSLPIATNRLTVGNGKSYSMALTLDSKVEYWGDPYSPVQNYDDYKNLENIVSLKTGSDFSVALHSDGTISAWGGYSGQSSIPEGLSGVIKIEAGEGHILALKSDGTVIAWGKNFSNQCDVPTSATDIIDIAAGYSHSMALKSDGTIVAWGDNYDGQLGTLDSNNIIEGIANIKAISTYSGFSLALNNDGELIGIGTIPSYLDEQKMIHPLNIPSFLADKEDIDFVNIESFSAGSDHAVVRTDTGEVIVWGFDHMGQVFSGPEDFTVVNKVEGANWIHYKANSKIVEIVAGSFYTLALKEDGTVTAWGNNNQGQCDVPTKLKNRVTLTLNGNKLIKLNVNDNYVDAGVTGTDLLLGDISSSVTTFGLPLDTSTAGINKITYRVEINGTTFTTERIVVVYPGDISIALGEEDAVYIEDGVVTAWGENAGILNIKTNVKDIAFGGYKDTDSEFKSHGIILKEDNSLEVFGDNAYGQTDLTYVYDTPKKVFAGPKFSAMISDKDEIVFWGDGEPYRDIVTYEDINSALMGQKALDFESTDFTILALLEDGTLKAFGDTMPHDSKTSSLTDITDIEMGDTYTSALKSDGTVKCWSSFTEMDINKNDISFLGDSGFIKIEAGRKHVLLLKDDGTVHSFGSSGAGEENWKPKYIVSEPVPYRLNVDGYTDVIDIKAFGDTSMALLADGTVAIWGDNTFNKINDIPSNLKNDRIINLLGDSTVNLSFSEEYKDSGIEVIDPIYGDVSDKIPVVGSVDTLTPGTYTITYKLSDFDSSLTDINRTIIVNENTLELRLIGEESISIFRGQNYQDQGARVYDKLDGTVVEGIEVIVSGLGFSTDSVGTHTITYTANIGGKDFILPRTVNVEYELDIVINGEEEINIYAGNTYEDAGAKLVDFFDNSVIDITPSVTGIPVDTNVVGTHDITYLATYLGKTYTKTRKVIVNQVDSNLELRVKGDRVVRLKIGETYNELGAEIIDTDDNTVNTQIKITTSEIPTNPLEIGVYKITYEAEIFGMTQSVTRTIAIYDDMQVFAGKDSSGILDSDGQLYMFVKWFGYFYLPSPDHPRYYNDYYKGKEEWQGRILQVAIGDDHLVVLRDDGLIWDSTDYYGLSSPDVKPIVPEGLTDVIKVEAGYYHSLALKADGTVAAWGKDNYGQSTVPNHLTDVVDIFANKNNSFAIKQDGTVISWGESFTQQDEVNKLKDVKMIDKLESFPIVLFEDGTIDIVGNSDLVPEGLNNVKSVTASDDGYIVHLEDRVLGIKIDNTKSYSFWQIDNSKIKGLATGSKHGVVLKENGSVQGWGNGNYYAAIPGQFIDKLVFEISGDKYIDLTLGEKYEDKGVLARNFTEGDLRDKVIVEGLPINTAEPGFHYITYKLIVDDKEYTKTRTIFISSPIEISAGYDFVVMINEDRTLSAYGENNEGQLNIPEGLKNVKKIASGYGHTLALTEEGKVVAFGDNTYGQCDVPDNLENIINIEAGLNTSYAISEEKIYVWGRYKESIERSIKSQYDVGRGGIGANLIAAGNYHSIAYGYKITTLGDSPGNYGRAPIGGQITHIGAGMEHSIALTRLGEIAVWGDSLETLPSGVIQKKKQFDIPSNLGRDVIAISAGYNHNIALKKDGTVVAWGDDTYGQSTVPDWVTDIVAIKADGNKNYALQKNGRILEWGDSRFNLPEEKKIKMLMYKLDDAFETTNITNNSPLLDVFNGYGDLTIKYAAGDKKEGYFKLNGMPIEKHYQFNDLSTGLHTIYLQDQERQTRLIKFEVTEAE